MFRAVAAVDLVYEGSELLYKTQLRPDSISGMPIYFTSPARLQPIKKPPCRQRGQKRSLPVQDVYAGAYPSSNAASIMAVAITLSPL
jgi:hypothetical protein